MSTPSSSYNTLIILRFYYVYISFSAFLFFFRVLSQESCSRATKRIWTLTFFEFLRYKKENELWQRNRAVLSKGKILSFPPLLVQQLMRRAEFTCPWTAMLCLSMLLNYMGWKKYQVYRNCPHKCDETYLGSVSDRQVQAIVNLLQSGRLNLEDPFIKTSFKSWCLARGKCTPTNLCISAGIKRKVAEG